MSISSDFLFLLQLLLLQLLLWW